MSTPSIATTAAATRRMIQTARQIAPPTGWSVRWRVEMFGLIDEPEEPAGWSDFDELEDAIANFRAHRRGGCPARIVAQFEGPVSGEL